MLLLNGSYNVLVQHPKKMRIPQQVTISWLYSQLKYNDGKWLIEGLGGLQPLADVSKITKHNVNTVSLQLKHSELLHSFPYNKIVGYETESGIDIIQAAKNKSLIVRRKCSEDITLYVDLWEMDKIVQWERAFFKTHVFYRITGAEYIFVNSCLMENT